MLDVLLAYDNLLQFDLPRLRVWRGLSWKILNLKLDSESVIEAMLELLLSVIEIW